MTLNASSLGRQIESCYGFASARARWPVSQELGSLAWVSAGDQKYAARLYRLPDSLAELNYHVSLMKHLEEAGVPVEVVVPATSGASYAIPEADLAVMLCRVSSGSPIPVPFDASQAHAWGLFVGQMHKACESWRPDQTIPTAVLRTSPAAMIREAVEHAADLPEQQGLLLRLGPAIQHACETAMGGSVPQPTHGDLWPGNLLEHDGTLRAIDFRCAGHGPRIVDVATAFRWMPWRAAPEAVRGLWEAWIDGYSTAQSLTPLERSAVPSVACLCQLYWLNLEASQSKAGFKGYADHTLYVRDHCEAIAALWHHGQRGEA